MSRDRGVRDHMSGAYGGGVRDVSVRPANAVRYMVRDTITRAGSEHVCNSCHKTIQIKERFCRRVKTYYEIHPTKYDTIKLCLDCCINS